MQCVETSALNCGEKAEWNVINTEWTTLLCVVYDFFFFFLFARPRSLFFFICARVVKDVLVNRFSGGLFWFFLFLRVFLLYLHISCCESLAVIIRVLFVLPLQSDRLRHLLIITKIFSFYIKKKHKFTVKQQDIGTGLTFKTNWSRLKLSQFRVSV